MKSLPWIFIFFIFCIEAYRISAFPHSRINDVIFDLNGEDIQSKDIFKRGYGKNLLAIGDLESNIIEDMKPHLAAVTEVLSNNPLGTYFEYLLTLCNDYPKLREVAFISKNIRDFVAESKDPLMNSFFSFVGSMIPSDLLSPTGEEKYFLATSIRTDNEDEVKLEFEKHEEAMRKAAEKRKKLLARAAKMHEMMWKTVERHRQAALDWVARFGEQIIGNLGNEMTNALSMGGMDTVGSMGGMTWIGGRGGMETAKEPSKNANERGGSRKRGKKDLKKRQEESTEDSIEEKKKPNRSSNDPEKIMNQETSSDATKETTEDLN